MRKLVKARPRSVQKPAFSIHDDEQRSNSSPVTVVLTPTKSSGTATPIDRATPTKASRFSFSYDRQSPRLKLAPASEGVINAAAMTRTPPASGLNGKTLPPPPANSKSPSQTPARMNSTIRPVVSFEDGRARFRADEEDSSTNGTTNSLSTSRNSALSSSPNSNTSASSVSQNHQFPQRPNGSIPKVPSTGRLKPTNSSAYDSHGRPSVDIPQRESSLAATGPPPPAGHGDQFAHDLGAAEAHSSNPGWDNSVGKAGLGKTGRVINKLVSDNEALKRDIQIERLRAEESKQAARLLEDKLERIVADYESRLLEANVTKALLARKERQVESLQAAVELERKRAREAAEREHTWKDEMDRARSDAKRKVDEANGMAALYEGRYNAISSHWKDQGEEVKKSISKMKGEMETLAAERSADDEKIGLLRDLCDQQDGNIKELKKQKESITEQFERYKAEQEAALRDIKEKARQREEEQERMLAETKEVLDKLKWALNVKDKVAWAQ